MVVDELPLKLHALLWCVATHRVTASQLDQLDGFDQDIPVMGPNKGRAITLGLVFRNHSNPRHGQYLTTVCISGTHNTHATDVHWSAVWEKLPLNFNFLSAPIWFCGGDGGDTKHDDNSDYTFRVPTKLFEIYRSTYLHDRVKMLDGGVESLFLSPFSWHALGTPEGCVSACRR